MTAAESEGSAAAVHGPGTTLIVGEQHAGGDAIVAQHFNQFVVAGTAFPLATDFRAIVARFVAFYRGSAAHRKPFVGRQYELDRLDTWLADPGAPRLLLLTAEAGRGKSALLVQWAARVQGWPTILLPVSIRFETHRAEVVLPALAAQLAQLFEEELPAAPFDALQFYRDRIASYLERLDGVTKRCVLVIDGIDEAAGWRIDSTLLPARPAAGLRIVIAARLTAEASSAAEWRRRLGWDALSAEVRTLDLTLLARGAVRELVTELVARLGLSGDEAAATTLAERLLQLTQGDPLLLSLYAEDIAAAGESELTRITASLSGRSTGLGHYFDDWMTRVAAAAAAGRSSLTRPGAEAALLALACALGPLRHEELVAVLARYDAALPAPLRIDLVRALSRFVIGNGDSTGYVLGHPRFDDHLRERHFQGGTQVARMDAAVIAYCRDCAGAGAGAGTGTGTGQASQFGAAALPAYVRTHYAQHVERLAASGQEVLDDAVSLSQPSWRVLRLGGAADEAAYAADLRIALPILTRALRTGEDARQLGVLAASFRVALSLSSMQTAGRNLRDEILSAAVRHGVLRWEAALDLLGQRDAPTRISSWLALLPYLPPEVVAHTWEEIFALLPRLGGWSLIGVAHDIARLAPPERLPALLHAMADLIHLPPIDDVLYLVRNRLGTQAPAALKAFAAEASMPTTQWLAQAHLAAISSGTERDHHRALALAVNRFNDPSGSLEVLSVLLEFVDEPAILAGWLRHAQACDRADAGIKTLRRVAYRLPAATQAALRDGLQAALTQAPPDDEQRALLAQLVDEDPGSALETARAQPTLELRAEYLARAAARHPEPQRSELLLEARALLDDPAYPAASRYWLLRSIQRRLGIANTPTAIADATAAARVGEYSSVASNLALLSNELPTAQAGAIAAESLRAARRIDDVQSRCMDRLRLAQHLDTAERERIAGIAFTALDSLSDEYAFTVVCLAGEQDLLPPAQRPVWLHHGTALAARSPKRRTRADLYDAYRADFPAAELAASVAVLDAEGDASWAFHLLWMQRRQLPPWRRAWQLGDLLQRARALPDDAERAVTLALFPRFHPRRYAGVRLEALAAARVAPAGYPRMRALLAVAGSVAPAEASALHTELLSQLEEPVVEDHADGRAYTLRQLAQDMPLARLDEVLRATRVLDDAAARFDVHISVALRLPFARGSDLLEPFLARLDADALRPTLSRRAAELLRYGTPAFKRRVFGAVVEYAATSVRLDATNALTEAITGLPDPWRRPCAVALLATIDDLEATWP